MLKLIGRKLDTKRSPLRRAIARWQAASVIPGGNSCEAARKLAGQRFVSGQAPRLPLPQCPQSAACLCKYGKHPDRRAGPRRAGENDGWRRPPAIPGSKRIGRGRRAADKIT